MRRVITLILWLMVLVPVIVLTSYNNVWREVLAISAVIGYVVVFAFLYELRGEIG